LQQYLPLTDQGQFSGGRRIEDAAERMLLGRCSEGPKEPNIGAEDFLQHLGMDAVIALRPLADRENVMS
jgi:hypothetical protein